MRKGGIYFRLAVLLIIVLCPLFILQFIENYHQYHKQVERELQMNYALSEAIGVAFMNYLDTIWSLEMAVNSLVTAENNLETTDIAQYMMELAENQPTVQNIIWINQEGIVKFTTNKSYLKKSFYNSDFFQRILQGSETVVSDPLINCPDEDLIVARGVWKDNTLYGVTATCINTEDLNLILPITPTVPFRDYGLVGRNGGLIFRNDNPPSTFKKCYIEDDSPIRASLKGEIRVYEKYNSNILNEERMGVSIPLTEIGWAAFASASVSEIRKFLLADIKRNINIVIAVAVLSFVLVMYIGRQFLKPIAILQKTAHQVAAGDWTARTYISGQNDLNKTGQIFDEMMERIEDLEVSRLRFVQQAAHELRNPMAGIKGILALIQQRVAANRPIRNIQKLLQIMDQEINRLARLVNQILEAFRTQEDNRRNQLNTDPINLQLVLESAVDHFRSQGIKRIKVNISENVEVLVRGDFDQLETVIRNLIENALKYSKPDSTIIISLLIVNGTAVVSIKDQGIGIKKGEEEKIFESFQRGTLLPEVDPGGMGLGLYISREIINQHQGEIWAEQNPKQGSTFYVRLPIFKL